MKKETPKEVPFNLSPDGLDARYEAIQKLSKRLSMLFRELEVYNLDMSMYAKSLAKGSMPRSYVEDVTKMYQGASEEFRRIAEAWEKIFKEDNDVADVSDK